MKLGTRGSDLALWQARFVRALLLKETSVEAELVIITTAGDRDQSTSLAAMTGKSFFTKDIEEALLSGEIDLAVHSLKDLQTDMPPGLELAALTERADRRDLLLIRPEAVDAQRLLRLREGASVGTSASRRIAQLKFMRPDLSVETLRGNVPTRVRKLREGQYDAIVAAAAGLERLELDLGDLTVYPLPETLFVPAPGQGALAIQIRSGDEETRAQVSRLDQASLRSTVLMEREVLRRLEGGCQLALGTASDEIPHGFRLTAFLGTADPTVPRRIVVAGKDSADILDSVETYLRGDVPAQSDPVRVWITREGERAEDFVTLFQSEHFDVSALPVFRALPAGSENEQRGALGRFDSYDWVLLTSRIAVGLFAELIEKYGVSWGARTRVAAIGCKTAAAIRDQGWRCDFTSDVADARSFGASFLAATDGKIGRVLFPCAAAASDVLASELAGGCESFERLVCYDTVEHPDLAAALAPLPRPDAVVFTSPRTARFLLARCPPDTHTKAVSIGPATTEALLAAGFPVVYEAMDRSLEGTAEVIHGLFTAPASPPLAAHSAHS